VGAAAAVYRIAFSDRPLPWAQPGNETQIESVDAAPEPVMEEERLYEDPLHAEAETPETESEAMIAETIEKDLLLTEDETDLTVESDAEPLEIAAPSLEELGITEVAEEPVTNEGGD
ncbi:MAG: hypothetical protein WD708_11800, partial [Kiritimatiellia bacterium]